MVQVPGLPDAGLSRCIATLLDWLSTCYAPLTMQVGLFIHPSRLLDFSSVQVLDVLNSFRGAFGHVAAPGQKPHCLDPRWDQEIETGNGKPPF